MLELAAADGADAKIAIKGVHQVFRDRRTARNVVALDGINLEIKRREFLAIVGPSGCGKTTVLNIVAGMIRPSQGSVRIDGREVAGLQSDLVGYMFARDALFPWRTVRGNVVLGLEYAGQPERRQRAEELIRLVGLAGFEDHFPDQLSQGMRQRVALARSLARDPEILLMDEPFGALDAQTRVLMQNEFVRIWEANQKTVILVTHDLVEALALADRVAVFTARPGRIKAEYRVDLPRPRVVDELQDSPEFQDLHRRVWQDLKAEALQGTNL